MVQSRDRTGFAFKALGELLRGELDGDVAAETRIGRAIHRSHAPFTQLARDSVTADGLAYHCYPRKLSAIAAIIPYLGRTVLRSREWLQSFCVSEIPSTGTSPYLLPETRIRAQ